MKKFLSPSLVIFATLLGNTLEWFDYLAFAFLAPVFAINFSPHTGDWRPLFDVLVGFSFGNLFRPVGALIFGYLGDRYGRKFALIGSIFLMTIPTLIIGLLPTYAQIGLAALILISIMRLLQGIATGGEFPCSMTFLVEYAPVKRRTLYGSFAYIGMVLGILLGGTDYFILNHFFYETLFTWGWRSVYILGAIVGFSALFLRIKLHETHPFNHLRETHEIQKHPIHVILKKYKLPIFKVFGIQVLQTVGFNLFISFSIIYFTHVLNLSTNQAAKLNLVFLGTLLLSIPIAGWIANSVGYKKIICLAAWGHLIFSFPFYWMLQIESLRYLSLVGFGLLAGFYMAPTVSLFCDLFPTNVRLSGLALGYNLSVALIGGFTPLVALWLIRLTSNPVVPAYFLTGAALVSLLALRTVRAPAN